MATIKRKTKKNTKKGKTFRRNQKGGRDNKSGKPPIKFTVPSNYKKREKFKEGMVMFPGTLVHKTFSLEPNKAAPTNLSYNTLSTKGSTTKPSFKTARAAENLVRLASQTNPQARLLQQSALFRRLAENPSHVKELLEKYGSNQVSATADNVVKNFLQESVQSKTLNNNRSIARLREALTNPEHEQKIMDIMKTSANIRKGFGVPSSPYEERLRNILEEHQQKQQLSPEFINFLNTRQMSASVETNA